MSDRRVITRQREKNEARRRQLTRRMNVSAVVQRLINPLTSYKINDVIQVLKAVLLHRRGFDEAQH